jgi:hypothetical protein
MRKAQEVAAVAAPWRGLYGLVALGLVLRLAFALASQSVHHPDEVFQYLEQAHRLAFGYGLVPWEYRFGVRSWLLPLSIAAPLLGSRAVGAGDPAVYIPLVKGLFCLFSVWLIVSCYRIGRNLVSEAAGRLAAVLACFWYELVYFAPRPLTDAVATYFLVAALAYVTDPKEARRPLRFGLCVAMAVVIRVQYLPVAGFLFLLAAATWSGQALLKGAGAALGAALLAGFLDRVTWGSWFVSYHHAYLFNVTHGIAKTFGVAGRREFFVQLRDASVGLFPLAALLSLGFARRLGILIAWVVLVVGMHTVIAHKEYRYIFAAIPVLLVLAAAVTTLLAGRFLTSPRAKLAHRAAIGVFALASLAGIQGLLPGEHAVYPRQPLYARQDELEAFAFLHRQADLSGVLLRDVGWWHTGGYYYLHRDVPLYVADDEEAMRRDGGAGPRAYASHVVCPATAEEIPGFARVARFGDLDVRKQLAPPASYAVLASYSRHVRQPGVDGVHRPSVTPRW